MANELGFDLEVETLIRTYEGNVIKPLDLGNANGKIFTSVAGVGFDGIIIQRMHDWRTGHISHLDYFWPIWRTFWEYTFPPIKVIADGVEVHNGPGLAFVGNISRYAIGLHILKNANYGDGKLDLCIFKCKSQGHLMKHSLATLMKTHTKGADCHYQKAESFEISSPVEGLPSQIDGDPGPDVPIKIRVVPGAIKVMVPPDAKPAGIRTRIRRMIG